MWIYCGDGSCHLPFLETSFSMLNSDKQALFVELLRYDPSFQKAQLQKNETACN